MPGVKLTVSLDDVHVQRALHQAMKALADPAPVLKDAGEYLLRSVEMRFRSQIDPEGHPWKPLAPSTKARKRHSKILTESTRLRRRIVYQVHGAELHVGTNVVYGRIHQLGGTVPRAARSQVLIRGRKGRFRSRASASRSKAKSVRVSFASIGAGEMNIPARPYLGLSTTDRSELVRIVRRHLRELGR